MPACSLAALSLAVLVGEPGAAGPDGGSDDLVRDVRRTLDEVAALGVQEHTGAYDEVDRRLRDALARLDQD